MMITKKLFPDSVRGLCHHLVARRQYSASVEQCVISFVGARFIRHFNHHLLQEETTTKQQRALMFPCLQQWLWSSWIRFLLLRSAGLCAASSGCLHLLLHSTALLVRTLQHCGGVCLCMCEHGTGFFCVPEWWCDDGESSLICVCIWECERRREVESYCSM